MPFKIGANSYFWIKIDAIDLAIARKINPPGMQFDLNLESIR